MREIKFRVWDKESNQWVTSLNQKSITKINYDSRFLVKWNRYVLLQYTGLKDKNGKEIYDGDVVKYWHKFPRGAGAGEDRNGIVHWNKWGNWEIKENQNPLDDYCTDLESYSVNIEVIGNIHENPELIKS